MSVACLETQGALPRASSSSNNNVSLSIVKEEDEDDGEGVQQRQQQQQAQPVSVKAEAGEHGKPMGAAPARARSILKPKKLAPLAEPSAAKRRSASWELNGSSRALSYVQQACACPSSNCVHALAALSPRSLSANFASSFHELPAEEDDAALLILLRKRCHRSASVHPAPSPTSASTSDSSSSSLFSPSPSPSSPSSASSSSSSASAWAEPAPSKRVKWHSIVYAASNDHRTLAGYSFTRVDGAVQVPQSAEEEEALEEGQLRVTKSLVAHELHALEAMQHAYMQVRVVVCVVAGLKWEERVYELSLRMLEAAHVAHICFEASAGPPPAQRPEKQTLWGHVLGELFRLEPTWHISYVLSVTASATSTMGRAPTMLQRREQGPLPALPTPEQAHIVLRAEATSIGDVHLTVRRHIGQRDDLAYCRPLQCYRLQNALDNALMYYSANNRLNRASNAATDFDRRKSLPVPLGAIK